MTMPFPKVSTQPYFPASGPVGSGKLWVNPSAVGTSGNEGCEDSSGSAGVDDVWGSGTRVRAARVTPGRERSELRQL
jgi:hypothetical protein